MISIGACLIFKGDPTFKVRVLKSDLPLLDTRHNGMLITIAVHI